ncbi:hypothetical protein TSTA_022030 [Talaromyces stipitatus ATCC 10500]|uniref:Reverse transcriptase Ty1/copia-type domain-containing protein n=1 Tax=Talaromyces stipitatus (strain ATCC 10500 / CBS 375.48 / QM 6759 / NRRL 1006) TaxID=441959 RepID=B8MHG7_TALSN|nr:uncharacterized protein TSTA_022030 [Talaromyces stipitatus ATCC 10500]EED17146.1 hypothetical protein TSTA_022030 [Talaromyces stipitatus ATCC 10500]
MVEYDPPAPTITQRAAALKKAMTEVRDALNTRNGPASTAVHLLPINSDVRIWREGNTGYAGEWKGPYKLLSVEGETCTIQFPDGPKQFRTTVVRLYYKAPDENNQDTNSEHTNEEPEAPLGTNSTPPTPQDDEPDTSIPQARPAQRPQRNRQLPARYRDDLIQSVFAQFDQSQEKEINGLLENGVFKVVKVDDIPKGTRIFNSRFVNEIKNWGTDKAFEKSRLVVQAYNDKGKEILTTPLARNFYIRPPPELVHLFPPGTILKVVKPLYGIPEAGNHWFRTYHSQGFGIVGMQTDDTLILANNTFANREENEIKQANILCKPREKLTPSNPLKFNGGLITEDAQGTTLTQERTCKLIRPVQDRHADTTSSRGKVRKDVSPQEQYVAQRALGAYIASVSQPEASFDLSFAAQITNPTKDDIKSLNKRLQWQLDNAERGLHFVHLDLDSLRLVIFADSSFANNKDFSSQIGFVIVLADAANNANIVYWSSIKCKRVTRSVLASELYAMVHGFDSAASIKSTTTQLLHLTKPLPLVICTDSKSLYECLVKLGTTQEKRLMIDLMCLRQSYERQEIAEIKWIDGESNPADAMTKSKPCRALQALIDTNKLNINVDGWVERSTTPPTKATPISLLCQSCTAHHPIPIS